MISFRAVKLYSYVLLFLVTLMIFSPVTLHDFLNWDDYVFVVDNVHIGSLSWSSLYWMITSFHEGMWLPFTWLSHAVDRALWGLDPAYHHLMNAIIHSLNGVLVLALFVELAKGERFSEQGTYLAAFAGALLFGLHPLRVEAVAWVSERKGLLCAFFFLSSLIFYVKYARAGSTWKAHRYYVIALVLCFLALLSKSVAVSLPLVFLILDYCPLERLEPASWRHLVLEKIPFLILSAVTAALNMLAFREAVEPSVYVPFDVKVMGALYGVVFYLKQTVFPEQLLPLYQMDPGVDYFGLPFVLSALLVAGLTVGGLWMALRGNRLWLSVWLYYLVTLAPSMSLFMYQRYGVQDRYTYLPALGFWLLAGLGVGRLWDKAQALSYRRGARAALVGCVALLAIFYGSKTAYQIPIWQNTETLWTHVLAYSNHPPHPALFGLGLELEKKGEFDKALAFYGKALSRDPKNPRYVAQMANVIAAKGDPEKALSMYTELTQAHPRDAYFHFHRGRMFALMGRDDEALAAFEHALEIAPRSIRAWLLIQLVKAAANDRDLANGYYRRYLSEGYAPDPDLERQLGSGSGRTRMPK